MKLRRQVLLTNLFWACALVGIGQFVFGCNGDQKPTQDVPTIRFWHFWSEPSQRSVLKELISDFEEQYKVRVELTELSWNDGKTKLQMAFNSGAPPDVVELGSDWVAQFSSTGVLMQLPLDSAFMARFVPYSRAPGMWQGKLYAYPWTVDTRVLWVNEDLLESSGWKGAVNTFADLQKAAELVHSKGGTGFGANGADVHRLYKKILPFMWSMGGEVVDQHGQIRLNSPENIKALELYAELARTGYIETQRQLDAAFLQGNVAFWMSGSWLIPKVKAAGLNARATLIPGMGAQGGVSFAGGEYLAVSRSTQNTQRSRELIQFLTSPANTIRMCSQIPEAGFPADVSAIASPVLLTDTLKVVFSKQLEFARMTPVHPRWLDIEGIIENAVVKVLLGEASAKEALDDAQTEVQGVIAE